MAAHPPGPGLTLNGTLLLPTAMPGGALWVKGYMQDTMGGGKLGPLALISRICLFPKQQFSVICRLHIKTSLHIQMIFLKSENIFINIEN